MVSQRDLDSAAMARSTLAVSLEAAVPLWIAKWRNARPEHRIARAQACGTPAHRRWYNAARVGIRQMRHAAATNERRVDHWTRARRQRGPGPGGQVYA